MTCYRPTAIAAILILVASLVAPIRPTPAAEKLQLEKGDRICLIGNSLAERMQYFGHFETLLHARFPQHELVVRNLGWSADELTLRPRSLNFGSPDDHLTRQQTDVVLALFGFNESFAGAAGLPKFKTDLAAFIEHTQAQNYNGKSAPRLALISPIAAENLGDKNLPDGTQTNKNLQLYAAAMAEVAGEHGVPFVDLFTPTLDLMAQAKQKLTFNGIHLTDDGDRQVAPVLDEALFGAPEGRDRATEQLRAEVNGKNLQFFYRYRAVNGYYIYGDRSKLDFGKPALSNAIVMANERNKLDDMCAVRDRRIWTVAQGGTVPAAIDDGGTRQLIDVPTNYTAKITYLSPADERATFKVADGYDVNLFASEAEFPELANPVQMTFDARGRLWVCTMPSYPQYLPPHLPNDQLLILEDTNGDGKADKSTVFAEGLHLPTGFELGDGGVYIAQQPNLLFLKDTNGDDRADFREIVLHGFDSADSHHSISAFTWGPDGGLYFQEGTFHHSQVETPYGPTRVKNAGVFRYEPTTQKTDVFVSYGFANPWGHIFDKWGQNFVADASGGANYFGTAFSGYVDYEHKHGTLKQFINKRVRPTAGCEIISSRHFPDEAQGNFLLTNVIGFQGILQHKLTEDGSGFVGTEIEPLLVSTDPNFRPIDQKFGPDGALYLVDWYNPLIGHMQHHVRDPNRDHSHGRIWRVTYNSKPLLTPPQIAGEPIPVLLDLLKSYEDRTRYLVRRELRERDTDEVVAELKKWVASLDHNDADFEHHKLEALWVYQQHNVVNDDLLKELLRSPDYRARAAATRVLGYWRDRVDEPLELLRIQVNDDHPRVRLEAVRACSFFQDPAAAEVALECLTYDIDDYLQYTLDETIKTLDRYVQ